MSAYMSTYHTATYCMAYGYSDLLHGLLQDVAHYQLIAGLFIGMWACHVGVTDVENFARSNMQKVIGIDDKTPVIF